MKKLLSTLLMASMLFSLAACGTTPGTSSPSPSGTTSPSSEPTPTGTVQGVTDTEVVVANSAATSGTLAAVGVPYNAGIEAYFKMVNEAGGVDGRKITFKHITDDEGDPVKGKAALQNMVEDEKVFAVVGHFATPVVAATIEDLKEYGIPAVYFASGIGQLRSNGAETNAEGYNIFPVQPLYATEGRILTGYAVGQFNAKKIGVIYTNDDAGMDLYDGVKEQVAELSGIEVVAEQVTAGSADVSAAVTSIKNANVDFIVVAAIQTTFPTIVKELAAQGVNKDCITTYSNTAITMSEAVVNDIAGKFDVYSTGWVDFSDPSSADFLKWIPADYAGNSFAMAGWIAGASFTEGLRRLEGKNVSWESYMSALEEAPIQLPFGAAVNYADGNRWGTQSMNLSKVVPVSDTMPLGWEAVSPMTNIEDLLK